MISISRFQPLALYIHLQLTWSDILRSNHRQSFIKVDFLEYLNTYIINFYFFSPLFSFPVFKRVHSMSDLNMWFKLHPFCCSLFYYCIVFCSADSSEGWFVEFSYYYSFLVAGWVYSKFDRDGYIYEFESVRRHGKLLRTLMCQPCSFSHFFLSRRSSVLCVFVFLFLFNSFTYFFVRFVQSFFCWGLGLVLMGARACQVLLRVLKVLFAISRFFKFLHSQIWWLSWTKLFCSCGHETSLWDHSHVLFWRNDNAFVGKWKKTWCQLTRVLHWPVVLSSLVLTVHLKDTWKEWGTRRHLVCSSSQWIS